MFPGDEFEGEKFDTTIDEFKNYEEYLNHHINPDDLIYLESKDIARQLIELGIYSKIQILSKDQFYEKKKHIQLLRLNQNKDKIRVLCHKEIDSSIYEKDDFLKKLAEREEDVLNGRKMVIIYIRAIKEKTKFKNEVEISGYIDLAARLRNQDFKLIFENKELLLPKPSDLSFYNWNNGFCINNDSPNFKVDTTSGKQGIIFRNKRDRKIINVHPNKKYEIKNDNKNTDDEKFNEKNEEKFKDNRIEATSLNPIYKQIVLFDHITRRKN